MRRTSLIHLLLLWPLEETLVGPEEAAAGWRPLAAAVDLRVVPGDHYTAMISFADAVAEPLREALRETGQRSSAVR